MQKEKTIGTIIGYGIALALGCLLFSCSPGNEKTEADKKNPESKIAVLMVNHGSRSETWRNALLALESSVKNDVLSDGKVKDIRTAFMEYTEPSIATRLKELDNEGFTDIIIVPIFLTVSPHSFDDIPTIIGQKNDPKSAENLKLEKIECYTPKAHTHITPLLDFTSVLERNILRRYRAISADSKKEGLVMIAYGDETYVKEWSELLTKVGRYVSDSTGIGSFSFGWCGHIAHYNPDSTTVAINRVLQKQTTAAVVPVLVAHDEMFQVKIIGDGINKIKDNKQKVLYKPDAILPDPGVEKWVKDIIHEYTEKIAGTPVAGN